MIIYLGRHGETTWNEKNKLHGWTEVSLNQTGVKEAKELGSQIANLVKTKPEEVFASSLQRTIQTAEEVAKRLDARVTSMRALRCWDVGELVGTDRTEAFDKLKEFIDEPKKVVPGGESFESFKNRFLAFLQRLMKHGKETSVLITHSQNLSLAESFVNNTDFKRYFNEENSDPGALLKLYNTGDKWHSRMV